MPDTEIELVDKNSLIGELRSCKSSCSDNMKEIVILDCRSANDYATSHLKQSTNVSIPTIMLRRLKEGKIDLFSTIKCIELKNRILSIDVQTLFVLYHNSSANSSPEIVSVLARKLMAEFKDRNIRVAILAEGFPSFQSSFPEWCEDERSNSLQSNASEQQLMGFKSLRISNLQSDSACSSSTESDGETTGSHSFEPFGSEPVEILPGLFLGNASHSEDLTSIQKYNIRYILNVSTLPNVFEETGKIKYLQIPITDHWSQDLSVHFTPAINFIEESKSKNVSCLVHCLAGVSRSVSITLAYLMFTKGICMNDAFNFVRARKPDISPNFHFMEQLHTFERQISIDPNKNLNDTVSPCTNSAFNTPSSTSSVTSRNRYLPRDTKYTCSCNEVECKCNLPNDYFLASYIGVSPDSGIEFDRWTSHTNTPK